MQAHLGTLDLDVNEGTALFHLLDAWQRQVDDVVKVCECFGGRDSWTTFAKDNGDGEAFWEKGGPTL